MDTGFNLFFLFFFLVANDGLLAVAYVIDFWSRLAARWKYWRRKWEAVRQHFIATIQICGNKIQKHDNS